MSIAVDTDLVLDFLTDAQGIQCVPYTIVLDGITYVVYFDPDQFTNISFRIINSIDSNTLNQVYLLPAERLLTYYDPYYLEEMDGYSLFDLYGSPAFGLKTSNAEIEVQSVS